MSLLIQIKTGDVVDSLKKNSLNNKRVIFYSNYGASSVGLWKRMLGLSTELI